MGKVIAICTSPAKGTQKTRIEEGTFIEDFGLEGDAHAGKWHRQISLLSQEKVDAFSPDGDGAQRREPFDQSTNTHGAHSIQSAHNVTFKCKDW